MSSTYKSNGIFNVSVDGGNAIEKIVFLPTRASNRESVTIATRDAATLVASGPQGRNMCKRHVLYIVEE